VIDVYTCGIDVHKLILQIAIVDKHGRVVHKEVCKYTPERVIALAYKLLKHQCKLVAMESSGVFWVQVFYSLIANGLRAILVNPFSTRAYGKKTDLLDAIRIARNALAGAIISSYVPKDFRVIVLRSMLRRRLFEDINRVLNRIHKLMVISGVFADRVVKPNSRAWLNSLRRLANGESVVEAFGSKGALYSFRDKLSVEETIMLSKLLNLHDLLRDSCKELEDEAIKLTRELYGELYDLLQTVPGIGRVLASYILAEVGDISRFPSARHFKSYCGLVPKVRESGGKVRLSRCRPGNPYLRWAFYQAAVVAVRVDPELRVFYERLVSRGKSRRVALVAVTGKIAVRAWFVLVNRVPYRAS